MQQAQLLTQCGQALAAARTDSYEVWEGRRQWWCFHDQSMVFRATLERWRASFPEIRQLDLIRLLPGVDAVYSEIDHRLMQVERMLAGDAPAPISRSVTVSMDAAQAHTLTHFQRAALEVTRSQLDRLEQVSLSLFDAVRAIKGVGPHASKSLPAQARPRGTGFDPDRLQGAVIAVAALWIGFLMGLHRSAGTCPFHVYVRHVEHFAFVDAAEAVGPGAGKCARCCVVGHRICLRHAPPLGLRTTWGDAVRRDAAGKDGTINHVLGAMNPQGCPVTGFKVPSKEEAPHDFLWRYHKATPGKGQVAIFNRSHYEDVLVVRMHDMVPKGVWSRRYEHINNFEKLLADNGTHILKFYLHIDPEEELAIIRNELQGNRQITLVYAAKDTEHNQAVVLLEYFTIPDR